MTATEKARQDTAAGIDRVGKVFTVLPGHMRRCLVCERIFTRQAAANHAVALCMPRIKIKRSNDANR